jgi:hypothetical protein
MMRNAFTCAGVQSSHRITGISAMLSLRAAFSRRWPSTTSPSLRASAGILKPNSRMLLHIRSTAESFLRGSRVKDQLVDRPNLNVQRLGRAHHPATSFEFPQNVELELLWNADEPNDDVVRD